MPDTRRATLNAYAALALVMLLWAGNTIVARAVRGEIPPFTLALLRWSGALAMVLPFAFRHIRRDWDALWHARWPVLLLSLLGVAGFNAFLYSGVRFTTASNAMLLQASIPTLVVLFDFLIFRDRPSPLRAAGVALSTLGVLTVVLKLFNLMRPDVAVFGEKDAQQLAMVRRMVADLDVPVRIVGCPTVREYDGLAVSSRNRYLSGPERRTAVSLSRALYAGAAAVTEGPAKVLRAARAVLDGAMAADPPLELDYLVLVDPETFHEVDDAHTGPAVLAVAGRVGTTHLIDNMPLYFGPTIP